MEKLSIFYYNVCDVWKDLCEEHNNLLDQTCKEYSTLLKCDLETLEALLAKKQETVNRIGLIDELRTSLINEINKDTGNKISCVSELLAFMKSIEEKEKISHLTRYNLFLVDIIEKIQEQNKKNQLFINKALISIDDIKASVTGKGFTTYTSTGSTTRSVGMSKRS